MRVYELIQRLSEYGADQEVVFDAFIPGHEVNIDLGDRKVTGEISASTDIDLFMDNVEEVFERKTNNNGMAVHIAVSC